MFKIEFFTKTQMGAFFALFLMGSGAFAQDAGFCGQPLALTQGSYSITGEGAEPINTLIEVARGEPAYLELTIQSDTGITVETAAGDADPIIILFDDSGRMVRSDDDGAGDLNSRLGAALVAGVYCAQIRTLTEVPPAVGELPQGFFTTIPVTVSTGIVAGAGGCSSAEGLVTLDSTLAPGFESQILQGRSPGNDSFAFSLAEPTALSIGVRSGDFDTLLSLEDGNGSELGSDDDSGGGTDSYLDFQDVLPVGDYCVSISSYDNSGGAFNLTLEEWSEAAASRGAGSGAPANPCGDPNATTDLSTSLSSGFEAQDFAETISNGHKFYRFETTEPLELRLTARSNDFDTVLGLYNADGAEVSTSDDGEGLGTNSRIQPDVALPAGQYCLAVSPFSGEGSGSYSVTIEEMTAEAMLAEAYELGELLPPSDSGVVFTDLGLLDRTLRSDNVAAVGTQWFLFEVEEESLVVIDAVSLGDSAKLVMFDYEGTGMQVSESLSNPDAPTTRMVKKVGSGIYAIAVVRDQMSEGREVSLLSIQRYVRPPRRQ